MEPCPRTGLQLSPYIMVYHKNEYPTHPTLFSLPSVQRNLIVNHMSRNHNNWKWLFNALKNFMMFILVFWKPYKVFENGSKLWIKPLQSFACQNYTFIYPQFFRYNFEGRLSSHWLRKVPNYIKLRILLLLRITTI